MTRQQRYLRALQNGDWQYRVTGIYGRIVRTELDRPVMLTEDDDRKVVMVMGPSGLQQLLGRSGCDSLFKIGYSPKYISRNLARGKKFKLVVFERPAALRIATWTGAIDVVATHYPQLAPALRRALPDLKRKSLEQFEHQCGYTFYDAGLNKRDRRYMTPQRLLASKQTSADVRRFLFHTVHFSELFQGDGYTLTPDGKRGVREYMMSNVQVDSLVAPAIGDLQVEMCASR